MAELAQLPTRPSHKVTWTDVLGFHLPSGGSRCVWLAPVAGVPGPQLCTALKPAVLCVVTNKATH